MKGNTWEKPILRAVRDDGWSKRVDCQTGRNSPRQRHTEVIPPIS